MRKLDQFFIGTLLVNLSLFLYFLFSGFYPYPLILIHAISLVLLFIRLLNFPLLPRLRQSSTVIALFLFLLALSTRLYRLDNLYSGIMGDETTAGQNTVLLLSQSSYTPFSPFNMGHSTPLLYLEGFFISLLGPSPISLRLTSVLFGALTIPVFYLLCLRLVSPLSALSASLLFNFSYAHLINSRLAYESSAAIFFHTLSLFFLVTLMARFSLKYLISLGLTLGLGLLTYLSFRLQFISYLICTWFSLTTLSLKKRAQVIVILSVSALIVVHPLISYSLHHPHDLWARAQSLSIFHQQLSPTEFTKELIGNIYRTGMLLFFTQDPEPLFNPASTTMYDPLSSLLVLLGIIYLFKTNKRLLVFIFLLSLAPFANDILTLEKIPNFHYYGQAHPHTLRTSNLIPLIYLFVAFAWDKLFKFLTPRNPHLPYLLVVFILPLIVFINLFRYFGSPPNRYTYILTGSRYLKINQLLRQPTSLALYASPEFSSDTRITFYLPQTVSLNPYHPISSASLAGRFHPHSLTIVDPLHDLELSQKLHEFTSSPSGVLSVTEYLTPWNEVEAFIVTHP